MCTLTALAQETERPEPVQVLECTSEMTTRGLTGSTLLEIIWKKGILVNVYLAEFKQTKGLSSWYCFIFCFVAPKLCVLFFTVLSELCILLQHGNSYMLSLYLLATCDHMTGFQGGHPCHWRSATKCAFGHQKRFPVLAQRWPYYWSSFQYFGVTKSPFSIRTLLIHEGLSSWLMKWKDSDWKQSAGQPVVHRDLWERLDNLCKERDIKWVQCDWLYQSYLFCSLKTLGPCTSS